jgi:hypothetical protein
MKKIILILAVIITACNVPVEVNNEASEGAGFFLPQPDEKFVVGSDDITNVWKKYIDAHNKRDFESILAMESDSLLIVGPIGNRISGKSAHKEALSAWFEAEEPKWNMYWAMPYKGVSGGEEWIIAGHTVTTKVDGKIVEQNHMIDAKISDGKVELFYVYAQDIPVKESGE